jgi:prophage tail gpP-like protein
MPKREEIAEVEINGQIYRDWTSVSVQRGGHIRGLAVAQLATVQRDDGKGASATQLSKSKGIKTGDACTIRLAGYQVLKGFVVNRQGSLNAEGRGVQITAYAKGGDTITSSMPLKDNQYKDYTFEAIARKVLEPFDIQIKVENGGDAANKKFKDVSPIPGEPVWTFLDRLARMRGLTLRTDTNGDIIAGKMADGAPKAGDLVEGRNIISGNCTIDDQSGFSSGAVVGQQPGDDKTDVDAARKPAATMENANGERYRYRLTIAEMPGDPDDMKTRADREIDDLQGARVNASVVVRGWLNDAGEIWEEYQMVKVTSSTMQLDNQLAVADVLYTQDDSGTRTTLTLMLEGAMGIVKKPGVTAGDGGVLPAESVPDAKPDQ